MTTLALFRHAKAVRNDPGGDHARGLTASGRIDAARTGAWLGGILAEPVLIIASDARRTRETAELAFPVPRGTSELRLEADLYGASADDLLHRIRRLDVPNPVVLIGHNPGIGEAARMLAGTGANEAALARLRDSYPTSTCVVLRFDGAWADVGPGRGTLSDLHVRDDAD